MCGRACRPWSGWAGLVHEDDAGRRLGLDSGLGWCPPTALGLAVDLRLGITCLVSRLASAEPVSIPGPARVRGCWSTCVVVVWARRLSVPPLGVVSRRRPSCPAPGCVQRRRDGVPRAGRCPGGEHSGHGRRGRRDGGGPPATTSVTCWGGRTSGQAGNGDGLRPRGRERRHRRERSPSASSAAANGRRGRPDGAWLPSTVEGQRAAGADDDQGAVVRRRCRRRARRRRARRRLSRLGEHVADGDGRRCGRGGLPSTEQGDARDRTARCRSAPGTTARPRRPGQRGHGASSTVLRCSDPGATGGGGGRELHRRRRLRANRTEDGRRGRPTPPAGGSHGSAVPANGPACPTHRKGQAPAREPVTVSGFRTDPSQGARAPTGAHSGPGAATRGRDAARRCWPGRDSRVLTVDPADLGHRPGP